MDLRISRALISVSDKTGIIDFARQLHNLGMKYSVPAALPSN